MVSSLSCVYAQDYFIYIKGEKRYFEVSPNKILVEFTDDTDTSTIKSIVKENTSFQLSNISKTDNKKMKLISFQGTDKTNTIGLVKQWKNKGHILTSNVVFVNQNGEETAALTDQIVVRLKQESDYPILQKSIESYKISNIKKDEFDNLTYLLNVDYSSEKDAMQIANELYETGLFEYAEPDLMLFIKYATNDTFFPLQWNLSNTGLYGGTSGIDIKAVQAWTITTGSSNIKIAILDSGVDLTHPDLKNNLLPGYDATGGGNNGNQSGVGHGTCCAGIAAAQGNNSLGVAGVAYNCRILPIHMGSSPLSSYVANGLKWAKQNGARVVSMSFSTDETNDINQAISDAVSSGCVLVAAAGNGNASSVSYPASSPNVIAVGAISPCGQRKTPISCDGETCWGSNYGANLSVVAPGVLIPTTDIQGREGYNPTIPIYPNCGGTKISSDFTDQDYTVWFDGTSAACPQVAGIAALILSVRPVLTQAQVRQVIESTCTKLSGYIFSTNSSYPNGTWNNEVGYGLVNAYAAVQAVQCINDYINQAVTSNTTVNGCTNLNVQNITVTNNSLLQLNAPGDIVITGPFEIQAGSSLQVK